jgi:glutamyl-tRNA synthetase
VLARALSLPVPRYAHAPLWVQPDGKRLAKRKGAETVRALLEAGEKPSLVLGRVGRALGVCGADEKLGAPALADRMSDAVLSVAAVTDDGPRAADA